jgi:hypothetical protein
VRLLIREASARGVSCIPSHKQTGMEIDLTIYVNSESRDGQFYMTIRYVESQNLPAMRNYIGRGNINQQWELVLSPEAPFRWEVYRRDPSRPGEVPDYGGRIPEYLLDADLLTQMLRETLDDPPSALP